MLIISYDISNDKLRTSFSKYIKKYGRRIQYSVYEIRNSDRVLENILSEIEANYEKRFSVADSILILPISWPNENKVRRYGYAKNEELDFIFV